MWLLIRANGYALDDVGGRFDALAIEDGRIAAVGSTDELLLQFGARASRVLDAAGATVIPGFVDSHLHVAAVGEQARKLNLLGVRSKTELLQRVADYAERLPQDAWVLGGGWDENQFDDPALPTLDELDGAAGGRPLWLSRVCLHAYLANRAALARAGVSESSPDPADGKYGRDAAGRLNGLVYENASRPIVQAIPAWSRADWKQAVRAGMEAALRAGITEVHTDDARNLRGFAPVWETYHALIHDEGVRLRVHTLVDWDYLDECVAAQPSLPPADDWLDVGAVKLFADGALGGRTAWLSEPYHDVPGWCGTAMYSPEELQRRVRAACGKGFAAAIHAIGDAGLDAALAALAATPRVPGRHRIIHAEVVNSHLVARMAALGERLAVDIQPRFTVSDFPWIEERLGPERTAFACAWRTLKSAGLHLAGGSDAPIEPISPLLGVHAAVTRRPPFANTGGYRPEQALTALEAVSLFTRDAVFASGKEDRKGIIRPGWLADLTILDRDIVQPAQPDDIRDAEVLYTVVGGEVVYAADGRRTEWSA